MSMRISSLSVLVAFALASCAPESGAPEGESVECALDRSESFASQCVLERAGEGKFIIHHPDNTFVRVNFDQSTGILEVSDGALKLEQTTDATDDPLEFSTGPSRYRVKRALLTAPGR